MTLSRTHFRLSASISLFICLAPLAHAQLFEVPANDGFYTETLDILSPEQEQRIESALGAYTHETGDSIAILVTQSISGSTLVDAARETAARWKLETGSGNDILILAALADHDEVILAGSGVSVALPPEVIRGVIDTDIKPHFGKGEYEDGLMAAFEAVQKHIKGDYTARRYEAGGGAGFFKGVLVVFLLIVQYLAARLFWRRRVWAGAVAGGVFGLWLVVKYSWWLAVPVLIIIGAIFDVMMVVATGGRERHVRHSGITDGEHRRRR